MDMEKIMNSPKVYAEYENGIYHVKEVAYNGDIYKVYTAMKTGEVYISKVA